MLIPPFVFNSGLSLRGRLGMIVMLVMLVMMLRDMCVMVFPVMLFMLLVMFVVLFVDRLRLFCRLRALLCQTQARKTHGEEKNETCQYEKNALHGPQTSVF